MKVAIGFISCFIFRIGKIPHELKISQSTIEEIKSRVDIVDVIGDFVTLKRTGQHFKARSPFSDEKTPSFIVFPRNQNFKDFSSGKQGDAIYIYHGV
jgi:DNA primase